MPIEDFDTKASGISDFLEEVCIMSRDGNVKNGGIVIHSNNEEIERDLKASP